MDPRSLPQNVLNTLNAPPPSQAAMDALGQGTAQPTANDSSQQPMQSPGQSTLANPAPVPVSGGASIMQQLKAKNSPALATLATGMDKAASANPAATAKPGGWARAVLSGAQAMFSGAQGVLTGLGDAAAVGTVPSGGGALEGIARTQAARGQRLQEQDKNKVLMAEANARMIHEQKLIHQLDEASIQSSVDVGTKAVDKLKNGPSPAAVIAEGLTSDELGQYLKNNKIDPTKETAYPTGRKQVGENKDGTPIYRTTYTAMGVPQDVTLDDKDQGLIDRLNKYSPPSQGKWKPGTTMSGSQFNWVMQAAADNEAATMARNKTLRDTEGTEQESIQKLEAVKFGPEWTNALANNGNDPLKAYDAMMSNPGLRAKYPNLDQDIRKAYPNMDKLEQEREKKKEVQGGLIAEVAKDPTKIEGKTSSVLAAAQTILNDPNASQEQKQQAKVVQTQAQNVRQLEVQLDGAKELEKANVKKSAADRSNPNGLTGQAFLATLPPGRRAALAAINDGSIAVNPSALERTDKGQAFMDDVYAAYPDFKAYKGETWPKSYGEYMGNGATAKAKINYNTALSHLKDLYDNSTFDGLYVVGSKAYEDRQAAFTLVVNEVGKAVKTGVITQGEGDDLKKSLNGWLPNTAKERVAHTASLLKNKIDEFQTAFQDAAPSEQIKVPRLISPQAQSAYDYINGGGKQAQSPAFKDNPSARPPGTTGVAPGPGGKLYYHDIKGKALGLAPQGQE